MVKNDNKKSNRYWHGKHVLVTGAGGFIGSHLVEALVARGALVRAYVRYNSRGDPGLLKFVNSQVFEQTEIITGDLRDFHSIQRAITGVDHVFHLGALISIPYSYLHPFEVVETNVNGTLNVLLAAQNTGVEKVIHTSTSEVYGTAMQVPIAENHPLQGQSPYSASKIGADKLAESFFCSFDTPIVILRPFNTYGPRQSARAVIPTIITQALTQDAVKLGNLETRRDLTYVMDTVEGFLQVAETPNVEGKTFNLGTGHEISIAELADEIITLIGKPVEIVVESSRLRPEKSEVYRLLADNRLAEENLGWKPSWDLRRGLLETIDWIEKHIDLYQPGQYQL